MRRVVVAGACRTPCPSCTVCRPDTAVPTLSEVLALTEEGSPDVALGGGDATRWAGLAAFLAANAARPVARRVWVEAPAAALDDAVLDALCAQKAHGVIVQIEAEGERMRSALRVGDGEAVVAAAEARGLATQIRLPVRPKTFRIVPALAARLGPRPIWLELVRQDWTGPAVALWPESIGRVLEGAESVRFAAHRASERGYLPPCALPDVWAARPDIWRSVLHDAAEPNRTFPACAQCPLARRCHFTDAEALPEEVRATLAPVAGPGPDWERTRVRQRPVPAGIAAARRPGPDVICTTPWTTMEIVDPVGDVRQCCSTWTAGVRGNARQARLDEVWNGPGYQAARRIMSGETVASLCNPICSRLYDKKFAETELTIVDGSEPFVQNQLLLAEDIAARREVVRGRPLFLAICPSTYCNYNCIMCNYGRIPRREMPDEIWGELPGLLPTLRTLTLLGGEPLANPMTMRFLREFDVARTPDVAIDFVSNGSLLTDKTLATLGRVTLGSVTISVNAGTAEIYERVQRGIAFSDLLANLDALLRFRETHHRWFGITLSFVVQPASAHTLIPFGELARARNLPMRFMALNPELERELDFYGDDDQVGRVLAEVDRFLEWAGRCRRDALPEVRAVREAVVGEAAQRRSGGLASATMPLRRLPVVA